MNIYLIAYSFNLEESFGDEVLVFFQTLGDARRPFETAILLASELSTEEINRRLNKFHEPGDEWLITKVDKEFTGTSEQVDEINQFLKKHKFND